jgi:DNA-directed RNA polymerase specialized sigma24 family protein
MPSPAGRSRFDTTRWSLVLAAAARDSSGARRALATLCETYWYPLYAYVRRQGYAAPDAQDLTQAFFARLLEKHDVEDARRDRGRFRSFLLASLRHFLLNEAQSRRTLKRGGGQVPLSLDLETAEGRYLREPIDTCTPDTIFDRRWALTVLDRVLLRLRRQAIDAGKTAELDALKACLTGGIPHGSYRALGRELGLTEGAVKVAVHRMKRRFQQLLREEIAQTVLTSDAIDEEIQYLFSALKR